ncbi:hypothetical protein M3Y97_00278700 [Aphelenchoides bicaudatus]|nr:hypothetical protein M3Y97_00278700 [Aphelenchoides bicaudatus]
MDFLNDFIGNELNEEHRPTTSRQSTSSNDKILSVLSDMMFANGDSMNPRPECVAFMHDLLKEQLLLAINQAKEYADLRKEQNFKFSDLLHCFRRHPYFSCRFIKYVSDRLTLTSLGSFDGASPGLDGLQHSHKQHADIEQFKSAFKDLDEDGNLSALIDQCLEPEYNDLVKQERQARMVEFTKQMDNDAYNLFAKARRRCLCYTFDRHVSKPFVEWIGKSNLDSYSVLILNFLATEVVAQMVENARLTQFEVLKHQGQILSEHTIPVELLHYKNALRRNLGYQTSGNLLFGYVGVFVN